MEASAVGRGASPRVLGPRPPAAAWGRDRRGVEALGRRVPLLCTEQARGRPVRAWAVGGRGGDRPPRPRSPGAAGPARRHVPEEQGAGRLRTSRRAAGLGWAGPTPRRPVRRAGPGRAGPGNPVPGAAPRVGCKSPGPEGPPCSAPCPRPAGRPGETVPTSRQSWLCFLALRVVPYWVLPPSLTFLA